MVFSPQRKSKSSEPYFRNQLLAWYDANARVLPWRENRDPYRVWVSEIMLQQTRVSAVIDHYHEFLRRFPAVQKLASAREAAVLAAWSGLGYYRRARMLHAAAKIVATELRGQLPPSAEEWQKLPGIGRYTAAAIASIAFGETVAVVDGNVERVVQRVSGKQMSATEIWEKAENLLDRKRPGDFNQAMMELGAMVCTPRVPGCSTCPVLELCAARGEMTLEAKSSRQTKREAHYALDRRNGSVFLAQRAANARVMAGMWELPEISRPKDQSQPSLTVKHSIMVTDYTVHVWPVSSAATQNGQWFATGRLPKLALTGLARKILQRSGIFPASEASTKSSRSVKVKTP